MEAAFDMSSTTIHLAAALGKKCSVRVSPAMSAGTRCPSQTIGDASRGQSAATYEHPAMGWTELARPAEKTTPCMSGRIEHPIVKPRERENPMAVGVFGRPEPPIHSLIPKPVLNPMSTSPSGLTMLSFKVKRRS